MLYSLGSLPADATCVTRGRRRGGGGALITISTPDGDAQLRTKTYKEREYIPYEDPTVLMFTYRVAILTPLRLHSDLGGKLLGIRDIHSV